MKRVPYRYRSELRMDFLRKFQARERGVKVQRVDGQDIIVMRMPYSPQLRAIGIRGAYRSLLQELQTVVGGTFLRDTRFVIAHVGTSCMFLDTYCYNYTIEDAPKQLLV